MKKSIWKKKEDKKEIYIFVLRRSIVGRSSQVPAGVPRNREKLPLSTPKNESNLTRNWDIFEKMWLFPHSETAILPLERLPWGSASSYRRIAARGGDKCHIFSQKSQYLVKFDSFFGLESGNFSLFLGTQLDPETTSLVVMEKELEEREEKARR